MKLNVLLLITVFPFLMNAQTALYVNAGINHAGFVGKNVGNESRTGLLLGAYIEKKHDDCGTKFGVEYSQRGAESTEGYLQNDFISLVLMRRYHFKDTENTRGVLGLGIFQDYLSLKQNKITPGDLGIAAEIGIKWPYFGLFMQTKYGFYDKIQSVKGSQNWFLIGLSGQFSLN